MFRNVRSSARDPLLPTSSNARRGGGGSIYGGMRSSRPDISKSFIATIIWALVSVGLVAWGWLYCARRMEMSTFSCNHLMCKFELTKGGATEVLKIPRSKLVAGEMVRVKKGEIVRDYGRVKRSEQRKLEYSYAIVYMEADSEDDDDESYDSYEDDDDSYRSYDDEQESSEDDDGGGERTVIPPRQKTPPQKMSPEAKEAIARRKEEREKYTRQRDEDRIKKGLPPIKEPDEPPRVYRDDGDGRFPGDAATMEKIKIEKLPSQEDVMRRAIAEMEARGWKRSRQERMAKSTSPDDPDNIKPPQKNVEDTAAAEMEKKDGSYKQYRRGSRHERMAKSTSPDDPDNIKPPQKNVEDTAAAEMEKKDDSPDIARLEAEANEMEMRRGGGRDISSIEDHEELGELLHGDDTLAWPRPNGSPRKLLARRTPASRRSKQKLMEDASRDRDVHRKGHGHHQKSRPEAAHPRSVEEEEAEELGIAIPKTKTKHHHKAFHHEKDVPEEDRHHVHHGYHHRPGDVKVDGGWRHQNRQWHKHEKLKQLGTSYSLGHLRARKRKETIDNYVRKKIHKLEFTDSRRWRAEGVWIMFVGCMLAAFCLVLWFNGGGGPGGARTPIAKITCPMYAIILSLWVNAAVVIYIA